MDEIGGAAPGLPPGVVMVGMRAPQMATGTPAPAPAGSTSKGLPWSPEEHEAFIVGLQKFGKGNWRSISRTYVPTRTPTQVASHAQKYFLRAASGGSKRKSRFPIGNTGCFITGEPFAKLQRTSSPTDSSSPPAHEHASIFSPPPQHPSAQPHFPHTQPHHVVYASPYSQAPHLSSQLLQQPMHTFSGSACAPPPHSLTTTPVAAMGMPVPSAPTSAPLPPGTAMHAPPPGPTPVPNPLPIGSVVGSMPYYAHSPQPQHAAHPQPQHACVAPTTALGGAQTVFGLPCLSLPPAHAPPPPVGGLLGMHAGIPLHTAMGGSSLGGGAVNLLQPQLVGLSPQHVHLSQHPQLLNNPQLINLHQLGLGGAHLGSLNHNLGQLQGQLHPHLTGQPPQQQQQQQLSAPAATALPPTLLAQLLAHQQQQQQQGGGLLRLEPLGAHAAQLPQTAQPVAQQPLQSAVLPQQQAQPQTQAQQQPQAQEPQQVQQQPKVEEVQKEEEQGAKQQSGAGAALCVQAPAAGQGVKEGEQQCEGMREGDAQRWVEGEEVGAQRRAEGEEVGAQVRAEGEQGGKGVDQQQQQPGEQGGREMWQEAVKGGEVEAHVREEGRLQGASGDEGAAAGQQQDKGAARQHEGCTVKQEADADAEGTQSAGEQLQQQQEDARKPQVDNGGGADKTDSPTASDTSHTSSCSEISSHDSAVVAAALKAGLCRPSAVKGNPQQTGNLLAFLQPPSGPVAVSSTPSIEVQPQQEQPPQQELPQPQLQQHQSAQQKEQLKEQQQAAPRPSAFKRLPVHVPSDPAGVHGIPLCVKA